MRSILNDHTLVVKQRRTSIEIRTIYIVQHGGPLNGTGTGGRHPWLALHVVL